MSMQNFLGAYGVDSARGFLPNSDPIDRLPSSHEAWERAVEIVRNDPDGIRRSILDMPVLDASALLQNQMMTRRAMLLLSVLGSGYVQSGQSPATRIPPCISIPWKMVADMLGRPMIISHASIVLDNWSCPESGDLTRPESLRTMTGFAGGADEDWFYLVTVSIEAIGASLIPTLARNRMAMDEHDLSSVVSCLEAVVSTIESIREMLNRMYERCRPEVFYQSIRPYLSGWPASGVVYEGVSEEPVRLFGGSAAQSSLLQVIDAAMGITHDDERSGVFLNAMRDYMPPSHRSFIEWFERGPTLRRASMDCNAYETYDQAVDSLDGFRRDHMAITNRYITQQGDQDAEGTGGTEYGTFLSVTRRETINQKLG